MSTKPPGMSMLEYRTALRDPGRFALHALQKASVSLTHVSEHTGIPHRTIINYVSGRRPGLSSVRLKHLIQYVLWQKGELATVSRME